MTPLVLIGLGIAAWYFWPKVSRDGPGGVREARAILEVGPDADHDTIIAAHRRLIQRVHPDAGGSADLASRVTAARDLLLAELNRNAS